MNKQTKLVVLAFAAGATAFCVYKIWKNGRKINEAKKAEMHEELKKEALEQIKELNRKLHHDIDNQAETPDEIDSEGSEDDLDEEDSYWQDEEWFDKCFPDVKDVPSEQGIKNTQDYIWNWDCIGQIRKQARIHLGDTQFYAVDDKELSKLKYDANSAEAWGQYVDMLLVNIPKMGHVGWDAGIVNGGQQEHPIRYLLTFEWEPLTAMDMNLREELYYRRESFFGEGTHYSDSSITLGEVLIYFAESLNWDLSVLSFEQWLMYLCSNLGVLPRMATNFSNNIVTLIEDGQLDIKVTTLDGKQRSVNSIFGCIDRSDQGSDGIYQGLRADFWSFESDFMSTSLYDKLEEDQKKNEEPNS